MMGRQNFSASNGDEYFDFPNKDELAGMNA